MIGEGQDALPSSANRIVPLLRNANEVDRAGPVDPISREKEERVADPIGKSGSGRRSVQVLLTEP